MLEQGVADVRVVQPVRAGVVADLSAAGTMLRHFLHKALGRRPLLSPMVLTAHPTGASAVTRGALVQALKVRQRRRRSSGRPTITSAGRWG